MESWDLLWVYALGFLSQGLFAARLLIQWYLSEKEGRIVSPVIYWQLTLVATWLFIIYGILQNDFVIVLGMAISYVISVRNLQLEGAWDPMPAGFRILALALPFITICWMFVPGSGASVTFDAGMLFEFFFLIGTIGQLLLNLRFLYQWYYAEKMKTAILPLGFWVMTVVGSILVVIYAIDRFDPVLIFAQGLGLLAAVRNIQLHFKTREIN